MNVFPRPSSQRKLYQTSTTGILHSVTYRKISVFICAKLSVITLTFVGTQKGHLLPSRSLKRFDRSLIRLRVFNTEKKVNKNIPTEKKSIQNPQVNTMRPSWDYLRNFLPLGFGFSLLERIL